MGNILELKTNLRSLRLGTGPGEEKRTPFVLATELDPDFNSSPPKTPNTLELAAERRNNDRIRLERYLKSGKGTVFGLKQLALNAASAGSVVQKAKNAGTTLAGVASIPLQALGSGTGLHLSANTITGNTYYPVYGGTIGIAVPGFSSVGKTIGLQENVAKSVDQRSSSISSSFSPVFTGSVGIYDSPSAIRREREVADRLKKTKLITSTGLGITDYQADTTSSLNPRSWGGSVTVKRTGTLSDITTGLLSEDKYARDDQNVRQRNNNTKDYLSSGSTVVLKMSQAGASGSAGTRKGVDELNYLIYSGSEAPDNNVATKDLINFKIVVYEPGNSINDYLYFRAYLDSFNDNFTGDWNATKYIGRAEPVYNYTGFSRGISFGFKLAASSEAELIPLYKKFNRLAGTTSPSYSSTFMRGVFVKVTVGDYLKDVPGFFTSVQATWQTNYPWESSLGQKNQGVTPQLPHILDISVAFTPVHDFTPAYKESFISGIEGVTPLQFS